MLLKMCVRAIPSLRTLNHPRMKPTRSVFPIKKKKKFPQIQCVKFPEHFHQELLNFNSCRLGDSCCVSLTVGSCGTLRSTSCPGSNVYCTDPRVLDTRVITIIVLSLFDDHRPCEICSVPLSSSDKSCQAL